MEQNAYVILIKTTLWIRKLFWYQIVIRWTYNNNSSGIEQEYVNVIALNITYHLMKVKILFQIML